MFTNPLAPSKKVDVSGAWNKQIVSGNLSCNEFAIILNVYFKSPAPTALGPLGAPLPSFENLFQFHARSARLRPQFQLLGSGRF